MISSGSVLSLLRVTSTRRLTAVCAALQLTIFALATGLLVLPRLLTFQALTKTTSERAVLSQMAARLDTRFAAARSELSRLGESRGLDLSPADDSTMNALRDSVTSMAARAGATVRVFEQAGQGSDSGGFARISVDTNFLQLISLLEELEKLAISASVNAFDITHADEKTDRASLSLSFSPLRADLKSDSTCHFERSVR